MQIAINNGMNCDVETGMCEIAETDPGQQQKQHKPVRLLYFTDPICSSCWGIEPQLRKLKHEYGNYFDIDYRMGGLLKSWREYNGNDVNGPASVAKHWEEAGVFYQMPIDGDVWKEDPLHSSYPPAIAFKAAQLQDNHKADRFLRRIKEMVFMEKKNITKLEHLVRAAIDAGLDHLRFKNDFRHHARSLFQEDLNMARAWSVKGFPTIFFIDEEDNRFKVYGSKPYTVYEEALLKLLPGKVVKKIPDDPEDIFRDYDSVTAKEYAVFYDIALDKVKDLLKELEEQYKVYSSPSNAGLLWKVKNL